MDKKREAKDTYSATEVGTLIESFRGDVSIIAEKVGELSDRVDNLDTRLAVVEGDVRETKDTIKVAIPDIYRRISAVEAKV